MARPAQGLEARRQGPDAQRQRERGCQRFLGLWAPLSSAAPTTRKQSLQTRLETPDILRLHALFRQYYFQQALQPRARARCTWRCGLRRVSAKLASCQAGLAQLALRTVLCSA